MDKVQIYIYLHSIVHGQAVVTLNNNDIDKRYLPIQECELEMGGSEPRRALLRIPTWLAQGNRLMPRTEVAAQPANTKTALPERQYDRAIDENLAKDTIRRSIEEEVSRLGRPSMEVQALLTKSKPFQGIKSSVAMTMDRKLDNEALDLDAEIMDHSTQHQS